MLSINEILKVVDAISEKMCADFEQEDNYYLLRFEEDYNGRYIKFMDVYLWDDNGGYYETYGDHKKLEEHLIKSVKEIIVDLTKILGKI